jgi:hypothetical protein
MMFSRERHIANRLDFQGAHGNPAALVQVHLAVQHKKSRKCSCLGFVKPNRRKKILGESNNSHPTHV